MTDMPGLRPQQLFEIVNMEKFSDNFELAILFTIFMILIIGISNI
ncbi:MAG: hypothetical protein CM15mP19_03410 [Gammaproteobacteria bacterium]|nr:MAG: hypothetical protein CM15mP19_03410 [Gammaproteobacteria bacterium]|tara:strand:- start:1607 stop:1741 length:135 start_codon:yes stop_codon:yes gene_type:complete